MTATFAFDACSPRVLAGSFGSATDGINTWQAPNLTTHAVVGVSASEAYIYYDNAGTGTGTYASNLGVGAVRDVNLSVRFSFLSTFTGSTEIGLVGRYLDANNWYRAVFVGAHLFFVKKVAGTTTTTQVAAMTITAGTYYRLHFQLTGSALAITMWQDGTSEPAPQWSGIDSDISTPGAYGMVAIATGISATTGIVFDSFLAQAVATQLSDIYVNGATGSDGNPGTSAQPLATVQAGLNAAVPGAVVHILPGTYTPAVTMYASGTGTNPVPFATSTVASAKPTRIVIQAESMRQSTIGPSGARYPLDVKGAFIDVLGLSVLGDSVSNVGIHFTAAGCSAQYNHVDGIQSLNATYPQGGGGIVATALPTDHMLINANLVTNTGTSTDLPFTIVQPIYVQAPDSVVTNNIICGSYATGINAYHYANRMTITNNIISNTYLGIQIGGLEGGVCDNSIVANNIFDWYGSLWQGGGASIYGTYEVVREASSTGYNNQYLNNLVWGPSVGTSIGSGGHGPGWKYTLQNGLLAAGTINADPRFVNYQGDGTGDYHLSAISPAIAAGTTLGAPAFDYAGAARKTVMDIGPYIASPGMGISIGSAQVTFDEDSFKLSPKLDERWRCQFTALDYAGNQFFRYNQQVAIVDSQRGLLFTGFVADDKMDRSNTYPDPAIEHRIDCIDNRHLADKRTSNRLYTTPTIAGKIVVDMITDALAAEGVQAHYVTALTTNYPDWNTGTLTNVTPAVGIGDGYLSLSQTTSVLQVYQVTSDWSGGTFVNTLAYASGYLALVGNYRLWDDGVASAQTLFGNAGASGKASGGQYVLTCPGGNSVALSRQDYAGTWANGTFRCDVVLADSTSVEGFTYRTTTWNNLDKTYAYAVELTTSTIKLKRGSNSGSPSAVTLASYTFSPTHSPGTYTILVIVSGSSHTVYVNSAQYLSVTDGTYTAAGYLALRARNPGSHSKIAAFDNFEVVGATSGSWTSPSISITSVTTIVSSVITWNSGLSLPGSTPVVVQSSIDGGATYQNCANGGLIPGLTSGVSGVGKSVIIKVTFSIPLQASMTFPLLSSLTWRVNGGYVPSGTRVSPATSLLPVGRCGSTFMGWNVLLPSPLTTFGMDISFDNLNWIDVTAQNYSPIPGIFTQPDPTVDTFSLDTSANYASTNGAGGSLATWTIDTVNSCITAAGGSNALYLYQFISRADIDFLCDLDRSDAGGMVWRYIDQSNYYVLALSDNQGTGPVGPYASRAFGGTIPTAGLVPGVGGSQLVLYKVQAGIEMLLAWTSITFVRGLHYRLRVRMLGSVISITFDGAPLFTYSDASPLGTGLLGLYNNGGTARFSQVWMQPQGDVLSSYVFSWLDAITSDTSTFYTSTFNGAGSTGTWTWDTDNGLLSVSGGVEPVLVYNGTPMGDAYTEMVTTQAVDGCGLVCRRVDSTHAYALYLYDASDPTFPNTFFLKKIVAGAYTTLATGGIAFTRGDAHRFRLSVIGNAISTLMDGATLAAVTDTSVMGTGLCGLIGGQAVGDTNQFTLLSIQSQDAPVPVQIYTRQRLATSDITVSPQVLDLTIAAFPPTIDAGALIPSADYRYTFIDKNLDDAAKQSNYAWFIDPYKALYFQHRQAYPAPWILQSNALGGLASDIEEDTNLLIEMADDLYRNRQVIKGVTNAAPHQDPFVGDGHRTSFTLSYPVATGTVPVVTLNGNAQIIGLKGTSGAQWYYAEGDLTIAQDTGGAVLTTSDTLLVVYIGTFADTVVVDNTAAQAALAVVEGGTGIIEAVEDVSQRSMTATAGLVYAQQLLSRYCVVDNANLPLGRTFTFKVYRDGLFVGQVVTVFAPEENLVDVALLITQIDITMQTLPGGNVLFGYVVTATELANVGSWQKLLSSGLFGATV